MNDGPRIYLDHAATTPLRGDVLEAMMPHLGAQGFNASSLHAEGRAAHAALDRARATVAGLLGAKAREIVFTSGGTEADNLALRGAVRAAQHARPGAPRHVVTAAAEHHAVLAAVDALREEGVAVTVLGVDDEGRVAPEAFAAALRPETVVASIMLANNELGTYNPVAKLARIARARGVLFHTDAVQAAGHSVLEVAALDVDFLSLSAHKLGGPKGVGALYVREGAPLAALVAGGAQEAGRRAGTENVAGIAGLARAFELAVQELSAETPRLRDLRDRFEAAVFARIPDVRVNATRAERLPHLSSIAFAGADATELLVALDLAGVAVSTGSACAAGAVEPSHVLVAIGAPPWARRSTVRFSLGRQTSEIEVGRVLRMLPDIVASIRVASADLGTSHSGSVASHSEVRF